MNQTLSFSPSQRIAGVLAPVFAVRSDNDLGCGDTHSLCEFIDWVAELGFHVLQVLPINETGGDHSPYNAISSLALKKPACEALGCASVTVAPSFCAHCQSARR